MRAVNNPILIVEDDEKFSTVMTMALTRAGYTTLCVNTLRDANFKVRNQKFQCILLDIRLGQDSGEDIIQLLRVNKQTDNALTPIVVISGFLDTELVKAIAPHVQGALVKPFGPDQLLDRVKKALDK